jgi:DNA N-6-adenine-methyltransferase Dam
MEGGAVYVNPPHHSRNIVRWVEKAISENQKHGTTIVMLLPARTDTRYTTVIGPAQQSTVSTPQENSNTRNTAQENGASNSGNGDRRAQEKEASYCKYTFNTKAVLVHGTGLVGRRSRFIVSHEHRRRDHIFCCDTSYAWYLTVTMN